MYLSSQLDSMCYVQTMLMVFLTCLLTLLMYAEGEGNSKCSQSELVPCGDRRGIYQWEFCSITVPNQRIKHVHLDRRYRNGYCTKHNFGITTNHRRFWVHQWCYGTFIVCFVSEANFKTEKRPALEIDNKSGGNNHRVKSKEINSVTSTPTTTLTTRRLTSDRITLHSTKSTELDKHSMVTMKTDTTPNATEIPEMIETVSKTEFIPNVTSLSLTTLVSLFNITVRTNNLLPIQQTDRYPLQRLTERVWIIMVLGAASGLFFILIGVIYFIILKRCAGDSEIKDGRFSEENTSTAHLVESDTDKTRAKSVYDFIPIDPKTGLPSVSNDDVSLSERYSEVKTKDVSANDTKLNIYDRTSPENEYDILSRGSTPCRSMSETSNYSHLGDFTYSVPEEGHTQAPEQIQPIHIYAVLLPVDSEQFRIIEEEHRIT